MANEGEGVQKKPTPTEKRISAINGAIKKVYGGATALSQPEKNSLFCRKDFAKPPANPR